MELLQTTLCYLEKDGAYLMLHRVKKKNDVNHDKWVGVGGKFEPGEDALTCALREVREETGLTLRSFRYLFSCPNRYTYSDFTVHTLDSFFEGEVDSFDGVEVADDAAEALILAPDALQPELFGLDSIRKAVKRYGLQA